MLISKEDWGELGFEEQGSYEMGNGREAGFYRTNPDIVVGVRGYSDSVSISYSRIQKAEGVEELYVGNFNPEGEPLNLGARRIQEALDLLQTPLQTL